MLNIYRSRESIDKESFIYNHILRQREKGEHTNSEQDPTDPRGFSFANRTLVVVPDQYTLAAERQAMDRMKTDVLFDVEIISISRLGSRLLGETGGNAKTVINKYGRHMLISKVLRELRDELEVFKGFDTKETFIRAINDFISAAKQHEVTPGSLMMLSNVMSVKGSNEVFVRKLRDLSRIFAKYQEHLKDKYTDNEDLIDLYREAISQSELREKSVIWVYGFDSYTPKNRAFILALASRAKEVNLHLIYDENCSDEDLFILSARMTDAFRKEAEYNSVQVSVHDIKSEPTENQNHSTEIVRSANMYSEAEAAASYVLKLLREENYRFSDIVLICNDLETRGSVIRRVFNEYGMDVFDDQKRDALGSPVSVFVLSLLDILAYNFKPDDILRFLKTGLTGIPDEEIDELENYVLKYRIRGNAWQSEFTRGGHETRYSGIVPNGTPDDNSEHTLLDEIELTRQKVMSLVNGAKKVFDRASTYGEFARDYLSFLIETSDIGREKTHLNTNEVSEVSLACRPDLLNRIDELITRQEAAGLHEQAEATSQIWDIIVGLMDQIAEIMDDAPFDGVEFTKLLRSGLSELEVGVLPPSPDDILMGTMQRTRSGDCKAMLVIGANDGLIPRTGGEDVLFSPEELEYLAADDQDLGLSADLRLMEENLAIYRNLSKPTEHLWISYSTHDQKGDELRPSEIINDLHEALPDLVEQSFSDADIIDTLGGKVNTLRRYTEARRSNRLSGMWEAEVENEAGQSSIERKKLIGNQVWNIVEEWLSAADDETLRRVNRALHFDNIQKPLPGDLAAGLYSKYIDRDGDFVYKFSPTTLERYSRCPFSYFMDYGLRPEELRIDEVDPRDIGELYHSTLQRFTEIVGTGKGNEKWQDRSIDEFDFSADIPKSTEGNVGWKEISREESDALVERLAKEWADEYRSKLFEKAGSENYRFNRAVNACKFIAWTLVEHARAGAIKESYFETVFASGGENAVSLPPIVKKIPGGKAYIQGKIDRIDILEDNRVKIIDYKTGKESLDVDEINAGYRLQLMLYLQAAQNMNALDKETLKPAGVFYFLISEPELNLVDIKGKNKGVNIESGSSSKDETKDNEDQVSKLDIEEQLKDFYRMEGIMVDEESVIKGIAGDLYDEEGEPLSSAASKVVKLKRKKDGGLDSHSQKRLLTEENFGMLQNTVNMIANRLCQDIASGKIDLTPMKSGNKTPCDYCNYKSICRFDTIFPGCRYEVVK